MQAKATKKNILFAGYYGTSNWGDEAILAGLARALKPHHHVAALSFKPRETTRVHGIPSFHRYYDLIAAFAWANVFVLGGGSLLQDVTSFRSLQYYLSLLRMSRYFCKHGFVFAQSIGPLSTKGEALLQKSLQGIAIAVRDPDSQSYLAGLGLQSEVFADAAFLLEPHPTSEKRFDALLIPRAKHPEYSDRLIELAQSNPNKRLATLAMQKGQDEQEVERLQRAIPELERVTIDSLRDLQAAIAASRSVYSVRLHGLILAAKQAVPYVGLAYDPKVSAFLAYSGMPSDIEGHYDIEGLTQNQVDSQRIALLEQRSQEGIDWLCKTLI